MGWHAARADREDIDISQEAVMEQGREVGEKARNLYPGGLWNWLQMIVLMLYMRRRLQQRGILPGRMLLCVIITVYYCVFRCVFG